MLVGWPNGEVVTPPPSTDDSRLTLLRSLIATIKQSFPALLPHTEETTASPIPVDAPPGYFDARNRNTPHVDGIGEPVTACFFTGSEADPKDW